MALLTVVCLISILVTLLLPVRQYPETKAIILTSEKNKTFSPIA